MPSPTKQDQPNSLVERYQRLLELSSDLSSTLDLNTLLQQIVNAAADLTGSLAASILLYDEVKNVLYFQVSTNLDTLVMRGLVVPVDNSIAGAILTGGKPLVVMNVDEDSRHFAGIGESVKFKTESLLGVPLVTKEKVIGVLETLNKSEGKFTKEDETLLSALGSQAAVAIDNAHLFQQSDLIAEIVHELRTPLSSISTAAHLLQRPEISQEQLTTMAQTIHRETNRLSEMVTTFLDLARLESGRVQFKKEKVDLKTLLEESAEIMQSRVEEQGLSIKWHVPDDLPAFQCDRDKLKQVALNLISNAIKYNRPKGTITIGAAATQKEISFYVKDTGRGILPEHITSLFQKFYRVPGSEQVAQGTGLGLSISNRIVEVHGGGITVKSKAGKGTTFTVTLPLFT